MKIFGLLLIFIATWGGFLMAAGIEHGLAIIFGVIAKAFLPEFIIIMGCAISAFIIGNSMHTIKGAAKGLKALVKPSTHSKKSYIELLSMMFTIFKLVRTKGWLAVEQHIENPHDSDIFKQFPEFYADHHATVFLCDYLRIISLGTSDPRIIEALMDEEIDTITTDEMHPGHAVQNMADAIPALGIVAAVLGIIKTMGSISEPPAVLGKMIGSALVGTFLGVWLSYAFIAPIANAINGKAETTIMYFKCMKVGVIAYLNGAAPQVAVEFARKFLPHDVQPSFQELEEAINNIPAPGSAPAAG
jgi:chemotaxis protein MotA